MLQNAKKNNLLRDERGISLISVALLVVVMGLLISSGTLVYTLWKSTVSKTSTRENINVVQQALHTYRSDNGNYPCPAPLDAGVDTGAFGTQAGADCLLTPPIPNSLFQTAGVDGEQVKIGTVPTRTLGIDDKYMMDGYGNRLIYAVTSQYAVAGTLVEGDGGDISIVDLDATPNNATAKPGTVVQVVYSMGDDQNGAFDANGNQVSGGNCDTTVPSGENCDFLSVATIDATFANSLNTSNVAGQVFDSTMRYPTSETFLSCADLGLTIPKDVAFVVDTSGSMNWSGGTTCPSGYSKTCKRIFDAQWAMRRVMLARTKAIQKIDDPGQTSFTGFAKRANGSAVGNAAEVKAKIGDILFDDPTASGWEPEEDDAELTKETLKKVEEKLEDMCPGGGTPLGSHMRALADQLEDKRKSTKESPNKLIVLSDGENTVGESPFDAINNYISVQYPNIKIEIVDVTDNPGLAALETQFPDMVTYTKTSQPNELLDALNLAAGICDRFTPEVNNDPLHCE